MDEKLRNQLTGAIIWFVLLIVVVGHWYSHPVDFDPDGAVPAAPQAYKAVIVDQPLRVANAEPSGQPAVEKQSVVVETHAAPKGSGEKKAVQKPPQASETAKKVVKAVPAATPKKMPPEKVGDTLSSGVQKRVSHPAKRTQKASARSQRWLVKVAAYFTVQQARHLVAKLKKLGYAAKFRRFKNARGQMVYSVRLAPVASKAEAQRLKRIMDRRFHTNSIIEPLPPQS